MTGVSVDNFGVKIMCLTPIGAEYLQFYFYKKTGESDHFLTFFSLITFSIPVTVGSVSGGFSKFLHSSTQN